ncbi:hypothetical protein ACSTJ7_09590 [Vibrio parahaemolyticus]|uniref:hypothetical protein n=1 Tax=Vibrio parahaemolyticus TaxID=670 RepID=UPI00111DCAAB|nr:hypothetical protein [Vibrio parahaemolyticus]TOF96993.1 hypothetical protein CGJ10_22925 [Vibrio parahaemolyticus]HCE1991831.1 hypothetical protein [Vibrio parahaemolyticus]HCG8138161.1 hypothetical protein [Vibrio parahaemolyticus]HCG8143427.1 hypothetical protein [Vibrio parahaemolyticus]HCG9605492.1 hypothetical protein [Vibrio parahaemolyticus]
MHRLTVKLAPNVVGQNGMMSFLSVRTGYAFVSLGIIVGSYYFREIFISEGSDPQALLSYFGTVASLVGLLIAVCEVIHSVNISKSIRETASDLLEQAKKIEQASGTSDCVSLLDDINHSLMSGDYKSAYKSFQHFRKLCIKLKPELDEVDTGKLNTLGTIEQELMMFTKGTPNSIPNAKIKKTTDKILLLKQKVEEVNPAGVEINVTT